jgi:hypothetical protein
VQLARPAAFVRSRGDCVYTVGYYSPGRSVYGFEIAQKSKIMAHHIVGALL